MGYTEGRAGSRVIDLEKEESVAHTQRLQPTHNYNQANNPPAPFQLLTSKILALQDAPQQRRRRRGWKIPHLSSASLSLSAVLSSVCWTIGQFRVRSEKAYRVKSIAYVTHQQPKAHLSCSLPLSRVISPVKLLKVFFFLITSFLL